MSATLAAEPVARFLDGCPIVEVPGRPHPLDIAYAPGESVADAVRTRAGPARAAACCASCPARPRSAAPTARSRSAVPDAEVVDLFGGLTADEQDRAVRGDRSGGGRRVILATNIAETSLTVPGVDTVVDTGLHKVARYDAARALDTLDTERVSQASADQRAGRAARLGPGRARRLWDARDRLRPHGEPDIARIDLAGPLLDLAAWGDRSRGVRLVRGAAGGGRGRGARAAAAPRRPRRQRADAARPADAGACRCRRGWPAS